MKPSTKPKKRPSAAPKNKVSRKIRTPSTRTGTKEASELGASQRTRRSSSVGNATSAIDPRLSALESSLQQGTFSKSDEKRLSIMRPDRAVSLSQKLDVLDRLYKLWVAHPQMRFMQVLTNALGTSDMYYMEDFTLIRLLEEFYMNQRKRT